MATIEVKVPDIGDYSDVPVIEVLVAVGDTVKKDQGLVTLESDKATLEVPSSAAGVVKEIKVKLGDSPVRRRRGRGAGRRRCRRSPGQGRRAGPGSGRSGQQAAGDPVAPRPG